MAESIPLRLQGTKQAAWADGKLCQEFSPRARGAIWA